MTMSHDFLNIQDCFQNKDLIDANSCKIHDGLYRTCKKVRNDV